MQTGASGYGSRGVIPRTISYIFRESERIQSAGGSVSVRVSYLEIYNEMLFDLLDGGASDLAVLEDKRGVQSLCSCSVCVCACLCSGAPGQVLVGHCVRHHGRAGPLCSPCYVGGGCAQPPV